MPFYTCPICNKTTKREYGEEYSCTRDCQRIINIRVEKEVDRRFDERYGWKGEPKISIKKKSITEYKPKGLERYVEGNDVKVIASTIKELIATLIRTQDNVKNLYNNTNKYLDGNPTKGDLLVLKFNAYCVMEHLLDYFELEPDIILYLDKDDQGYIQQELKDFNLEESFVLPLKKDEDE